MRSKNIVRIAIAILILAITVFVEFQVKSSVLRIMIGCVAAVAFRMAVFGLGKGKK